MTREGRRSAKNAISCNVLGRLMSRKITTKRKQKIKCMIIINVPTLAAITIPLEKRPLC